MTAGEDGADYVGFGIPAFVKDRETAIERQIELIAWWSEIFEVPCVAFDVADLPTGTRHAVTADDAELDILLRIAGIGPIGYPSFGPAVAPTGG